MRRTNVWRKSKQGDALAPQSSLTAKIYDAPQSLPMPLPPRSVRQNKEFDMEGELQIFFQDGIPFFVLDGNQLSEFVSRHFNLSNYDRNRSLGKVKVIIAPLSE